jgi:hypothetical protein
MPQPPPCPAAERFGALLQYVSEAVGKRSGWALTPLLIGLIATRLRTIKWRFLHLAARIAAGTYKPPIRSAAPRRNPAGQPRPAPPKDPLPRKFGWLRPLIVPETVAFAGLLHGLFQDPEMVALMQAAPDALGRPIRSLCRMLGVRPPPAVALPPRRKPVRRVREQPPPDPYPKTRLGFHKGLPPLSSIVPRLGGSGFTKKPA